jgi:hypothetical protein
MKMIRIEIERQADDQDPASVDRVVIEAEAPSLVEQTSMYVFAARIFYDPEDDE